MGERVRAIDRYDGVNQWGREAGYRVVTTEQVVTLAIDSETWYCEDWGYVLHGDPAQHVGAELRGVAISDTNRTGREFTHPQRGPGPWEPHVLLVDVETDRGTLQFAAFNSHDGDYAHRAHIRSRQLTQTVWL